ncbi:helix-turn-helix domain-containing protein [Neolewinella aurantiaca]|uniref:Helix-turn-helix domain-containing protein n=1 Tax=Neolewinella aurantiaca TaxID=2602767 RepID=A0A5C7FE97_9BACT|nr:AraC family transcriptional regulator [Neolewinella aurantiaca]TXF89047.1 helix-turn-helix domain-containing protein [Neolewinella aurantiaca]
MRVVQSDKPFEIQVLKLSKWQERPLQNNFFEVVYIASGEGSQCINYNLYDYKGGNIFLLPPLRCHSFTIDSPTEFVFLKFTKSFFVSNGDHGSDHEKWFREASYILANYQQQPGEVISNEHDRRNLIALIDIIRYEAQNQKENATELIKSLMVGMLHILIRSIKKNSIVESERLSSDSRLNEMTAYIQENLGSADRLKLENLAKQFHLSATYISEFFRKNMGVSLREYIARSRLKLVEIRLLYSDYKLVEIAEELGFTDASHLSRTFKKYSGQTIREFRRKGEYNLLKVAKCEVA